ncbi:MAG: Na+/H+ antiporter subunit E [Pirellulales bacterium]|nr:Na+/H+ antiporter subunit E [Pirellulales bacterium]
MRSVINIAKLVFNFFKDVVLSGGSTAVLILRNASCAESGTTKMSYGDLGPNAASLLGCLISLTPGTTTIEMDLERREFLIHLLDLRQRDATIATIRRDLLAPLLELQGKRA